MSKCRLGTLDGILKGRFTVGRVKGDVRVILLTDSPVFRAKFVSVNVQGHNAVVVFTTTDKRCTKSWSVNHQIKVHEFCRRRVAEAAQKIHRNGFTDSHYARIFNGTNLSSSYDPKSGRLELHYDFKLPMLADLLHL